MYVSDFEIENSETQEYDIIIYRWKTSTGQTVELKFQGMDYCLKYDHKRYHVVNVVLYINKRKRGYENLKQTGDCGLEGLLIAKDLLIEGMHNLRRDETLYVAGTDSRRQQIYERSLIPLGFKRHMYNGEECLIYINNEKEN